MYPHRCFVAIGSGESPFGVLVIAVVLDLPAVVLGEAFLSFIGLGINPPTASWGSIAQDGPAAYVNHPQVIIVPSLAIAMLVLSANVIADGLRDRPALAPPAGLSARRPET